VTFITATPALPTIQPDGTSTKDLQAQIQQAIDAVDGAIRALQHSTPHPRDYDPQDSTLWGIAHGEHYARLSKLVSVVCELEMIAIALTDI
jgi:hypothetical protein